MGNSGLRQHIAFDGQDADDRQLLRQLREIHERDRIAEHVVHPAHVARRRHRQLRAREPEVMAVARPQHQPVPAEFDRPRIAVDGGMAHGEELHGGFNRCRALLGAARKAAIG